MDPYQQQEESELESARIQDRFRRSGQDQAKTAGLLAFSWMSAIDQIADTTNTNARILIIAQLAELIRECPAMRNQIEHQTNEMSRSSEARNVERKD